MKIKVPRNWETIIRAVNFHGNGPITFGPNIKRQSINRGTVAISLDCCHVNRRVRAIAQFEIGENQSFGINRCRDFRIQENNRSRRKTSLMEHQYDGCTDQ